VAGAPLSVVSVRQALGTGGSMPPAATPRKTRMVYMQEATTFRCGQWYGRDPLPPGWHAITKAEYIKCSKPQDVVPGGSVRSGAGPGVEAPSPPSAVELYRLRQKARDAAELYRWLHRRAPRAPRPPRLARAPRAPRPLRPPRSARPPRAPRPPRDARPPRPPRAPRAQGSGGVWYCKINYYPGVGEVMAGPEWRTIQDPILPYTAGKGGYLPVPSPFACNGEACSGPFSGPLKALRDALWKKYNVTPAETVPKPPLSGTAPRPRRPPTEPTIVETRQGPEGPEPPSPKNIPAGCFLFFVTNPAARARVGFSQWLAPASDDPVARFGGAPSDYSFRPPPDSWAGVSYC
jgi:hypothetical protein